jgi:hypothetical protein
MRKNQLSEEHPVRRMRAGLPDTASPVESAGNRERRGMARRHLSAIPARVGLEKGPDTRLTDRIHRKLGGYRRRSVRHHTIIPQNNPDRNPTNTDLRNELLCRVDGRLSLGCRWSCAARCKRRGQCVVPPGGRFEINLLA